MSTPDGILVDYAPEREIFPGGCIMLFDQDLGYTCIHVNEPCPQLASQVVWFPTPEAARLAWEIRGRSSGADFGATVMGGSNAQCTSTEIIAGFVVGTDK